VNVKDIDSTLSKLSVVSERKKAEQCLEEIWGLFSGVCSCGGIVGKRIALRARKIKGKCEEKKVHQVLTDFVGRG